MKIAVISDIHGNLPALESVLDDINKRNADKIICLGDLGGKGPNSREAINICRKECNIILKGNWDDGFYYHYILFKQGKTDELSDKMMWYINNIGFDNIEYLGSLPHSAEFYLNGKLIRLFHAHPVGFTRYHPDSPVEKRLELFEYSDKSYIKERADVAVYADIHSAYMQILGGRHLLNVGSVGNPLDITQASYVMLEGGEKNNSSFGVQFIRVPYDIEKAVEIAKEVNVPDLDGYISELRTAEYFRRS